MYVLGGRSPDPRVSLYTTVGGEGDTSAGDEGEEVVGDIWVFFNCHQGAATTETLEIGNCRILKPDNKGAKVCRISLIDFSKKMYFIFSDF